MCKRNSPNKKINQHGMCKRNSPDLKKKKRKKKKENNTGCVRESPQINIKAEQDVKTKSGMDV